MMNVEELTGCCRARELYNLGGAHSVIRAVDQEEFDRRTAGRHFEDRFSYIAITNDNQGTERGYLTTQGWTDAILAGNNHLHIHTIGGADLNRYLRERNAVRPVQGRFQAPIADPAPNPVPIVPAQPEPVAAVPPALQGEQRVLDALREGPANVNLNNRRQQIRLDDVIDFCDFEAALVGSPQVGPAARLTGAMKNRLEYEYGIRLNPDVFYSVGAAHRALVQRARDPRNLFERF